MNLRFCVLSQVFRPDGIAIHILNTKTDFIATNIVMEKRDPQAIAEPPLQINEKEAQELMSQLWNLGIRPTDELLNSHAPNSLKAVEKHLEDMRSIAFDKLEVEKP